MFQQLLAAVSTWLAWLVDQVLQPLLMPLVEGLCSCSRVVTQKSHTRHLCRISDAADLLPDTLIRLGIRFKLRCASVCIHAHNFPAVIT